MVIALAAIICGADRWVAVAECGRFKQAWLHTFLDLSNGIPSHGTFGRVFARIDPECPLGLGCHHFRTMRAGFGRITRRRLWPCCAIARSICCAKRRVASVSRPNVFAAPAVKSTWRRSLGLRCDCHAHGAPAGCHMDCGVVRWA